MTARTTWKRLGTAITDPTGRTVTFPRRHMQRHAGLAPAAMRCRPRLRTPSPPSPRSSWWRHRRRHRRRRRRRPHRRRRRCQLGAGAPRDFPDPSILELGRRRTTPSPPRTSPRRARRSTSRCRRRPTASTGPSRATDALPTLRAWAKPGDTWAPSVAFNSADNDYVMYYTATEASTGDQCIGVATSATPLGPYTDTRRNRWSARTDSTTRPHHRRRRTTAGASTPTSSPTTAGNVVLDLEERRQPRSAEPRRSGRCRCTATPAPVRRQRRRSCWRRRSRGRAPSSRAPTCTTSRDRGQHDGQLLPLLCRQRRRRVDLRHRLGQLPGGPAAACTDQSTNGPLLAQPARDVGPGRPRRLHASADSGKLVMAFAAWQGTTIGYLTCGIRPMYLADLTLRGVRRRRRRSARTTTTRRPAASPACPHRTARRRATGRSPPTAASSPSARRSSTARPARCRLNKPVVGMAATPDGNGLLAGRERRRHLRLRRRAVLRLDRLDGAEQTDHRHDRRRSTAAATG